MDDFERSHRTSVVVRGGDVVLVRFGGRVTEVEGGVIDHERLDDLGAVFLE